MGLVPVETLFILKVTYKGISVSRVKAIIDFQVNSWRDAENNHLTNSNWENILNDKSMR